MKLKKWALVAEVLGGLGIIISIIYLAIEVSQNSANTEVRNHLAIVDQTLKLRTAVVESEEFADILKRGDAGLLELNENERLRYSNWAYNSLDIWESTLIMYRRGGTSEEVWTVYSSGWCRSLRERVGVQEVFLDLQDTSFTKEFAVHVNNCLGQ
jgi:hypothetical protein